MKLGLCIGTSPGEVKTKFALELAQECLSKDHEVELFLFDDGIYNALENRSVKCVTGKLDQLSEAQAPMNICVNMAKYRGVNEHNKASYIEISSLISFSNLINTSDMVVSTK